MYTIVRLLLLLLLLFFFAKSLDDGFPSNNNSLPDRDVEWRGRGGSLLPPPLQITSVVATRCVTKPNQLHYTTSYI